MCHNLISHELEKDKQTNIPSLISTLRLEIAHLISWLLGMVGNWDLYLIPELQFKKLLLVQFGTPKPKYMFCDHSCDKNEGIDGWKPRIDG